MNALKPLIVLPPLLETMLDSNDFLVSKTSTEYTASLLSCKDCRVTSQASGGTPVEAMENLETELNRKMRQ